MVLAENLTSTFSWRTEEGGRHAEITCQLEYGRHCVEKFCEIKSELKFKDNSTYFSWLLDFISSTVVEDESK